MQSDGIPFELHKILPGIIGSAGAMLWIKGPFPRRLAMVALGIAASWYVAPHLVKILEIDAYLAGFLVGLFGMSIVDSIFRAWTDLDISKIIIEVVRKRLGLPPAKED